MAGKKVVLFKYSDVTSLIVFGMQLIMVSCFILSVSRMLV
jgi:hypothetical protein